MAFSNCPPIAFVMFVLPKMICHTKREPWPRLLDTRDEQVGIGVKEAF